MSTVTLYSLYGNESAARVSWDEGGDNLAIEILDGDHDFEEVLQGRYDMLVQLPSSDHDIIQALTYRTGVIARIDIDTEV